jgi:D-amino-acid dehydrogenase
MTSYDVIVIGGGIVGASAGYHLAAGGARALLLDRADPGMATAAGAGIIAPEASKVESDAWFAFAVAAVEYYPQLVAQLQADGAGETGYAATDELIVAVSADEDAPFAATQARLLARQRRHGRPDPADLAEIDAAAARARFPALAEVRRALHHRRAARIDGRLMAAALRQAAVGRGLVLRQAGVEALARSGDRVSGVIVDGEELRAGTVILAGGAWSAALSDQLGLELPIAPQRGQIIHLAHPQTDTADWPIITAFHGHYILPWPGGRVVVGATRESVGFAPHTTAAGVREVLDEALRVAPGLASFALAEVRVGLRPGTPDHLPILGSLPGVSGLLLATGHGANGLQLGPFSGKVVAELALGAPATAALDGFGAARFLPGSGT